MHCVSMQQRDTQQHFVHSIILTIITMVLLTIFVLLEIAEILHTRMNELKPNNRTTLKDHRRLSKSFRMICTWMFPIVIITAGLPFWIFRFLAKRKEIEESCSGNGFFVSLKKSKFGDRKFYEIMFGKGFLPSIEHDPFTAAGFPKEWRYEPTNWIDLLCYGCTCTYLVSLMIRFLGGKGFEECGYARAQDDTDDARINCHFSHDSGNGQWVLIFMIISMWWKLIEQYGR